MPQKTEQATLLQEKSSESKDSKANLKSKTHKTAVAEQIWRFLFMLLVPIFYQVFTSLGPFHRAMEAKGISHGNLSDLKLSVVSAIFFYFIRHVWERVTVPICLPWIEDKHQGEERYHRAKRVSKWIYDAFYYLTFTVFAYIHFRSIIPTMLLGDGACSAAYDNYPAGLQLPWAQEYYLVQMGSHLHKIVEQCLKKNNDLKFWEYFLHHCLAFCLMLHSYMNNYMHIGIMILVTHDITDIFLSSMRAQEALKYKIPLVFPAWFIITFCVWTYCRSIVFLPCQVWTTWENVTSHGYHYDEDWFADITFNIQLIFLGIMNLYWIYALGAIFYKNVRHVSAKNILANSAFINSYDPNLLNKKESAKAE